MSPSTLRIRLLLSGWAALAGGCVMGPPPLDNPTSSPRAEQRSEARALEQAEAECAAKGKHAVAERSEGETLYHCAE
jgi:hypothetical protein